MPGTDLILGKSQPLPSVEEKIADGATNDRPCTLFEEYKPKPGGQAAFWDTVPFDSIDPTPYRAIWLRGGIGSGKSHVGSAFVCSRAFLDPTSRGLITANSYTQLETSTLIALASFCEKFNIPIYPKRATVEETAKAIAARRLVKIFDASLLVLSAEAFVGETIDAKETGRGLEVQYLWADEYAYSKLSVWNTLNGRLGRGDGKIKGLALLTSSINRNNPFNWMYDLFDSEERSTEIRRLYKSINCLTVDNDSLAADYVPTLEASLTAELAAIELRGEYAITAEGVVFSYFDRNKHVKPQSYNRLYPLHLSFDFNVNPATATISQDWGGIVHILREIYLLNTDTFKQADAVKDAIAELTTPLQFFYAEIHGDATGANRSANSKESNWDIIRNAFVGLPVAVVVKKSNPPVMDTIHAVNCLLKQNRIEVDPSCKETIKDFEQVRFDNKGGLDKKTDILRCQVIDTVRYLVFDLYPYVVESATAGTAAVGAIVNKPDFAGDRGKTIQQLDRDLAFRNTGAIRGF